MQGTSFELKHSIIRAGAGAGKTTGLVARVMDVYRQYQARGERPRIIVTTFTRKATQELKERLIKKACEAQDSGFLQFVTDPARLQIATIHGLLNNFLRQTGHLAGLDAGFQIVSEVEGAQLARLALRETLLAHPDGLSWLETYGFRRILPMLRAYEHAKRESGSLQAAGAADIQHAVARVAAGWKQELAELSASILEEVDDAKWIEFAQSLNAFAKNWSGNGAELDMLPSKPRNSKNQAHLEAWHERTKELLERLKKEMKGPGWNQELWPKMAEAWAAFTAIADDFTARLLKMKDASARLEMSDLELKSMEILREFPYIAKIFSENWDYWMIDEYQDTSPLQVACLDALVDGRPAYYVGDPQQSIYLFRGAEVRVFEEAERKIEKLGGERHELRRNYRSQPDLLLWINDFMNGLGPMFKEMEPARARGVGSRTAVTMIRAEDDLTEMKAIVTRVDALLKSGAGLEQICILGRTHRTLMDVSRALRERGYPTHVHSSRGFGERREVLDAQALWKFLVNPHDNLALMTLLRSPWFYVPDQQLAEWMQNRPSSLWRKLTSLSEDAEAAAALPESIQRLKAAHLKLGRYGLARTFESTLCSAAMIDLSLVNDPAGRKESNLWKLILRAREVEKEGGQSVLDFLDKDTSSDALDASEGDATSAQEPNSINLMTIHGSKGLEFEHVIVPRMGEASPPSQNALLSSVDGKFFFPFWTDQVEEAATPFIASPLDELKRREETARKLEEFDRWLYVALTRAKSTLTLSWSKIARHSWASRSEWFLREAGEHATESYTVEILEGATEETTYIGPGRATQAVRSVWKPSTGDFVQQLSVTDMINLKVTDRMPREAMLKRWEAQSQGTRVHRTLEALKWRTGAHSTDKATQFVLSIADPPMKEIIQDGEVEWGFQVKTPLRIVPGQIDLWGKHKGILYVVDYKSGSEGYKDSAFEQLGIYAWALRKFGHQEPIKMVVIYPLAQKFESRDFDEVLFSSWELEFGVTKA